MRFLILLLLILLAVWYFLPEPETVPAEDTFLGDQLGALQKAEDLEKSTLDADQRRREQLEQQAGASNPEDDDQR